MLLTTSLLELANEFREGTAPEPFNLERAEFIPDAKVIRPLEEILPAFKERMKAEYPPEDEYKYHNWNGHILPAEKKAIELIEVCQNLGIEVDKPLVLAIIYSHDARFHHDPKKYGAIEKEQIAGHLAYRVAKELGCSETDARRIEDGVFSTHFLGKLDTIEKKIARASDLSNVGGRSSEFIKSFKDLYSEYRNESKAHGLEPKGIEEWSIGALNFLGNFLLPLIKLSRNALDNDGRSRFHMKAIENILTLIKQLTLNFPHGSSPRIIAQIGGLGNSDELLEVIKPNDVVITCTSGEALNEQINFNRVASAGENSSNIFLPTHYRDFLVDIPDASCDVVILEVTHVRDFEEVARITKNGGEVIVCLNPLTVKLNELAGDAVSNAAHRSGLTVKQGNFDLAKATVLRKD